MEKAKMNILISGSDSFIGANLIEQARYLDFISEIYTYNENDPIEKLLFALEKSDIIFHLLTIYRSDDPLAYKKINVEITKTMCDNLSCNNKKIIYLSSMQSGNGTPYGDSKMNAEKELLLWKEKTGNTLNIYRIGNEFGKWCLPYNNSVVATFCYNVINNIDLEIFDSSKMLHLTYVDDIINCFIKSITNQNRKKVYYSVVPVYSMTVGKVAKELTSFWTIWQQGDIPEFHHVVEKKLFCTLLSYISEDRIPHFLTSHCDERGSFTELFHIGNDNQVSVNVSMPHIQKGNHWHQSKCEKFIVVSGEGIIKLRKKGTKEVYEYLVNGKNIASITIPPGYVHSIENTGDSELITIMWANEKFNEKKPDTYFERVIEWKK